MLSGPQKSPNLQRMLAQYERRIEGLKMVQAILEDDPGFAGELASLLAAEGNGACLPTDARGGQLTQFQQIEAFFRENGNKWKSAPEIIEESGLSRGAVGQALYRTHTKRFEWKKNPKRRGGKLWRMKIDK